MEDNNGAGKGDKRRPTDQQKYEENYDRIFGNKEIQDNIQDNTNEDCPINDNESKHD